jgi:hypothetical protein
VRAPAVCGSRGECSVPLASGLVECTAHVSSLCDCVFIRSRIFQLAICVLVLVTVVYHQTVSNAIGSTAISGTSSLSGEKSRLRGSDRRESALSPSQYTGHRDGVEGSVIGLSQTMVKSQGTSGKDLETGQALKILDEWRSEEVFLDRKQKTANVAKVAAEAELLKQKQEEEHVAKVAAESELLKQKQEEEHVAKVAAEAELLKQKQEEEHVAKVAAEAELLKQKQEEEHLAKVAAESELLKQKQEEEHLAKVAAESELLKQKQEEEHLAKVAAESELLKQKQEEEHLAKVAAESELLKQKRDEEYTAKQDLAVGIQQPAKVLLPLGVHEQLGRKEAGVLDIPVDESQKQQQQQQPQQQERAAQPVTLDIPEPLKQMQGTENRRQQPTDVEMRKQKQDNGLTEDFSLSKGKALT